MTRLMTILIIWMMAVPAFSQFTYTIHSNQEYYANPEYARQDAEWYENQEDISNAIICYKKYAVLSGKDMSQKITLLTHSAYPNWFDSGTMKAMPLEDGRVLVIYTQLMHSSFWEINNKYHIPGILGDWNIRVDDEIFDAIKRCGLSIPTQGLYKSSTIEINCAIKTVTVNGKSIMLPEDTKTWTLNLILNNGKRTIDCGAEIQKGYWNGYNVEHKLTNTKKEIDVYFYPTRLIKKQHDVWVMENADNSKPRQGGDVKATATANIEVDTKVSRSSYCR